MFAAIIGFVICAVISIWILMICLGVFLWPGSSRGEMTTSAIVAILVVLFMKWINPFTIAVTVVGP